MATPNRLLCSQVLPRALGDGLRLTLWDALPELGVTALQLLSLNGIDLGSFGLDQIPLPSGIT